VTKELLWDLNSWQLTKTKSFSTLNNVILCIYEVAAVNYIWKCFKMCNGRPVSREKIHQYFSLFLHYIMFYTPKPEVVCLRLRGYWLYFSAANFHS